MCMEVRAYIIVQKKKLVGNTTNIDIDAILPQASLDNHSKIPQGITELSSLS